ncbi:hypothetical protein NOC27_456 [Nitrosococcus oceani AFC27]|uniref:hypothetical protein n=1 Tax=Nitrosococcus oceani TaxID=1229 RepID=UPI000183C20A|nr:hypothetical protein [Nitrosococcus oceani]EDZ67129.1 hypothetical protein NOC27_456 [Nitrosococcus oceani AFC27]
MIEEDLLRLSQGQAWLEMEINDSLLFAGGSAKFGAKVVLVFKGAGSARSVSHTGAIL